MSASRRLLEAHLAGDKARAAEVAAAMSDTELYADLATSSAPTDLVRAFFGAVGVSSSLDEQRRVQLVKQACTLIDTARTFSARQAKACIAFLAGELDSFSARSVADIVMAILRSHGETLRVEAEAKSHELLPKCLALLACTDSITYIDDAGRHAVHYNDFQSIVVSKLCEKRWPHAALLPMMNTLRDLPLTDAQLRVVVGKALEGASDLELQALPALVYQLLLLAGRGCKLEVLAGLTSHFEGLEKRTRRAMPADARGAGDEDEDEETCHGPDEGAHDDDDEHALGSQIRRADDAAADPETLAAVQNTVILNIDLALRQDHGLGSTLLRMLKTHALQLSSFSLSLLLLLARQPRFEDEAIAWLTCAVRSAFNEAAWAFGSPWLEIALRPVRTCRVAPLLMRLTRPTGPEHLLPSIVLLATAWLDATSSFGGSSVASAGGGGNAAGGTADDTGVAGGSVAAAADEDERAHAMSSSCRLARLGGSVLVEVFRAHPGSHADILECILARVATRAPSCARWVQLLGRLARAVPTLLMHHVPRLRETLAYAAHLPPAVSVELLRALLPLSAHRAELRDAVVLALRKAAFQRDEGARLVAVHGFLLLLSGTAFSPAAVEPAAQSAGGLDSEVLGFLKRCLTHQAAVRTALYKGLPPIFKARPHLRAAIIELLAGQLLRYQEARTEMHPLDLHACLTHSPAADGGGGAAAKGGAAAGTAAAELEPLALLIRCLATCLSAEAGAAGAGAHSGAAELLEDIRSRMHVASLADFSLDKSTDFSLAHAHGQTNVAAARLLQSVLVALVEVEVGAQAHDEALGRAISLHVMHGELSALLKGGGGREGGKGAGASKSVPKAPKVPAVAPSQFGLALAPSVRILRLAVAAAKQSAAAAPDDAARDDGADVLHAPRGEPLLRCAVLSAQREYETLEMAARTEAACALVPLLLAEAELAVERALDGCAGADGGKEEKGGKEKEGGSKERPYGALVLDAIDGIVKATTDRAALAAVLRVTLASPEADDEGGGGAPRVAASMTSRPNAQVARRGGATMVDAGATDSVTSCAALVSEALRTKLEPMLARLLQVHGTHVSKEAEACLRVVRSLGARLPAEIACAHADWALTQCRNAPAEGVTNAVGRALVAHWLQLSARAHGGSATSVRDVLLEARSQLGAADIEGDGGTLAEDLDDAPYNFTMLHERNALALAQPAIERLDEIIGEIDKALVVLKRVMPPPKAGGASGGGKASLTSRIREEEDSEDEHEDQAGGGASHPALELQRVVLSRVLELETPLLVLTSSNLSSGAAEHALRTIEKLYRAMIGAFTLAPSVSRQHRAIVQVRERPRPYCQGAPSHSFWSARADRAGCGPVRTVPLCARVDALAAALPQHLLPHHVCGIGGWRRRTQEDEARGAARAGAHLPHRAVRERAREAQQEVQGRPHRADAPLDRARLPDRAG